MAIYVVILLDPEVVQTLYVDETELPVRQRGVGAHLVASDGGEQRGVGLLKPPLWAKDFRGSSHTSAYAGPNFRVTSDSSRWR